MAKKTTKDDLDMTELPQSPACRTCGVAFARSDMPDADQCGRCLPPVPAEEEPSD